MGRQRARRAMYLLLLAALAALAMLGLMSCESSYPRIEAEEGAAAVPEGLFDGAEDMRLLVGWAEREPGVYHILLDAPGGVALYLPMNADSALTVDGADASAWQVGDAPLFELPASPAGRPYDVALATGKPQGASGASLCLFAGTLPALMSSMQATAFLRFFVVGVDFAAVFYSLTLWARKRSEGYLVAMALYALSILVRVLRRALPAFAGSAALAALLRFPLWGALSAQGTTALNSVWSVFLDFLFRYLVLRAFFPVKLGRHDYFLYCALACAACGLAATFGPAGAWMTWMPLLLRLGCMALEVSVISAAYLRGDGRGTAALLLAWAAMLPIWLFNRACETGLIATYAVGSRVGLGGIQETVLLLGFIYAVNARFAGKFQEVDVLSRELAEANAGLEDAVREKTRELSGTVRQLMDAQRQRDEFLANLAHDIKTPLFSIMGYAEMARSYARTDPARAEECLDIVRKSTGRVQRAVQRLLLSFRLESGRVAPAPARCDPAMLLAQAVETVGPKARELGVSLSVRAQVEGPGAERACRVDGPLVVQALESILDNAIEACGPGGHVEAGVRYRDGAARIDVGDDGCGIGPEDLPHVFERYYSKKAPDRHGSGLGLAIAHDIVELSGGSIEVESEPGRGATFTVTLPCAPGPALPPEAGGGDAGDGDGR